MAIAYQRKQEVYDLIVNVSAELKGKLPDWPPYIQDQIWMALMRMSAKEKQALTIQASKCGYDVDTGWYIHVVAVGPWGIVQ